MTGSVGNGAALIKKLLPAGAEIAKEFPLIEGLQLFGMKEKATFSCSVRGGKIVTSKKAAVDIKNQKLLGNGGYGRRLAGK